MLMKHSESPDIGRNPVEPDPQRRSLRIKPFPVFPDAKQGRRNDVLKVGTVERSAELLSEQSAHGRPIGAQYGFENTLVAGTQPPSEFGLPLRIRHNAQSAT